jgi:FolB domain-containing protein
MKPSRDKIVIKDLEVQAKIGVTEAERARPQRLLVTVEMSLELGEAGRADDVKRTADYAAVAGLIEETVTKKPRQLIEAAAEDVAEAILERGLAGSVTVEIKKFSVARARHVAVQITRP